MMFAKAFMFTGSCTGNCGRRLDHEGGVSVNGRADSDADVFDGTWLCLSCARKYAMQILRAVFLYHFKIAHGWDYKRGKWIKPKGIKA